MSVVIDGTAGVTTPAVTASGTVEGATMTEGGVAMPRMVLETAKATTSGTSIDFNSIPSWVKRITVMFNAVSTNGTSAPQIQLGAGSVDATSYVSTAIGTQTSTAIAANSTTGFLVVQPTMYSPTSFLSGNIVFTLVTGNTWSCAGCISREAGSATGYSTAGVKTLSGTLDRLRLTTVNGTDTFDAGSVNLLLEG